MIIIIRMHYVWGKFVLTGPYIEICVSTLNEILLVWKKKNHSSIWWQFGRQTCPLKKTFIDSTVGKFAELKKQIEISIQKSGINK